MRRFNWFIVCCFCLFNFLNVSGQDLKPADWKNLTGYWKFQDVNNLNKATVGRNLVLTGTHKIVNSPAYGDTAVRIAIGSYYKAYHNIKPNGGGNLVNQFTLMFDFKVKDFQKWHTFFQTDTTNANDGEGFIRPITESNPGRIGTATTKYTTDSIFPNTWYRLVISVNLDNFYRYYLNGALVLEGDLQNVDGRFGLQNNILFFADNDGEDDSIDVASVAIFDTSLTAAHIAKLGTINPCIANPPLVNLGNDTIICSNNSLTIKAGKFEKFIWSTGETTANVTFDAKKLKPGKNNIWVRVTDINGCHDRDSIVVEFSEAPEVNLGADRIVCEGTPVNLYATTSTNSSYKYTWLEIATDSVHSTQNTVSITASGTYVALVSSAQGCMAMDTIKITVNPAPQKPQISISGPTDICNGDTVELFAPAGYKQYIWSNGATTENIRIFNSQKIRLRVMDDKGCYSNWSDTVEIKVNPLPKTPLLQALGKLIICEGDSILLLADTGFAEYIWNDGVGKANRTIKTAGTYSVYVKNASGCASQSSKSITVTVNPLPQIPVLSISGDVYICRGENKLISGPADFAEYRWSNGSTSQSVTVNESGQYSLQVKNSAGCWSLMSSPVNIIMHELPEKPKIMIATNTLGSSVLSSKYLWFKNGVLLSDASKNLVNPQKGYYKLQIFNDTCYSEMSDSVYFENTGIAEFNGKSNPLQLFPNPAKNTISIKLPNTILKGDVFVCVTDIQGKNVLEIRCTSIELVGGKMLDLQKLNAGIYYIKVITSQGIYMNKIQKL